MLKILKSTCCAAALTAAMALSAPAGHAQSAASPAPSTGWWASFEGGFNFSGGDETLAFDPEDKLGSLDSLKPGDDGFEARFEAGKVVDSTWDYKAGIGVIWLGDDTSDGSSQSGLVTADQSLGIGLLDLEIGYRPELNLPVGLRLSAGVRGLAASGESNWSVPDEDKLGKFSDETWAVGPRIAIDASMPINEDRGLSLVGSLGGAALFGERSSDYDFQDTGEFESVSYSNSVTIWNVDAMLGVNKTVGANGANFTIGYKAQSFGNLAANRYNVGDDGVTDFVEDGDRDVIVHGPFAKFTVPLN